MSKLLRSCDRIGAGELSREFKSPYGGALYLLLNGLCIIYGLYLFTVWRADLTPPRVGDSVAPLNRMERLPVKLDFQILSEVDPFDPRNMMVIPLREDKIMATENMRWQLQGTSSDKLGIQLIRCDQKYLMEGMKCAADKQIDQFINKLAFLEFSTDVTRFDYKTRLYRKLKSSHKLLLSSSFTYYAGLSLRYEVSEVDTGILFPQSQVDQHLKEMVVTAQSLPIQQFSSFTGKLILAQLDLEVDPLACVQSVHYVKLNEILASFFAIAFVLLQFEGIGVFINKQLFWREISEKVISYYFPEFKNVRIQRNFLGQIQQALLSGNKLDRKQLTQFLNRYSEVAREKLRPINIVYELSRLQFIAQALIDRCSLMNVHNVGIRLQLNACDITETQYNITQLNEKEDACTLKESDMYLLSRPNARVEWTMSQNQFFRTNLINYNN